MFMLLVEKRWFLSLLVVNSVLWFSGGVRIKAEDKPVKAELLGVKKIWDQGKHNAFTDLIRFQGKWYCAFREGQGHVSPDGAGRVLVSDDGENWTSSVRLTSPRGDVRDPKLCITPDGRLMVSTAVAIMPPGKVKHQSTVWFSEDGKSWSEPIEVADPNQWLWRVTWHEKTAYGVGYDTTGGNFIRLYKSNDGKKFDTLVERLFDQSYPNESSLQFLPDQTALCLLRRDGSPDNHGLLGRARPPYTEWTWQDVGTRIGGPRMIRLEDGRLLAGVRLYDDKVRTSLCQIDAESGKLTELLRFPSGGDTSYPGMVMHEGTLWFSYYSSHEGKTSIYLARIKVE